MPFSPQDSALAGFRLAKERPRVVLTWAVFYLVLCAALLTVIAVVMGPTIASEALAAIDNRPGDPTAYLELLSRLSTAGRQAEGAGEVFDLLKSLSAAVIITVALSACIGATVIGAVFRAVLRPDESQWAYLRFGKDELRLIVVFALLSLPALAVAGLSAVVAGVTAGLFGATNPVIAAMIGGLGLMAAVAIAVFVTVRLSLAPIMTFAERRIRFFASWSLTHGHFWRLVAMFLLMLFLSLVVSTVIGFIAWLFPLLNLKGLVELIHSEGSSLGSIGPGVVVGVVGYIVVSLLGSVLQLAIGNAPQAEAYKQLTEADTSAF
jgi:hypothetical protein